MTQLGMEARKVTKGSKKEISMHRIAVVVMVATEAFLVIAVPVPGFLAGLRGYCPPAHSTGSMPLAVGSDDRVGGKRSLASGVGFPVAIVFTVILLLVEAEELLALLFGFVVHHHVPES
jgi:hypothetical protein